jgi:hypothetical protein
VVLHLNVDSLKAEHEHGDNCNCDRHTAPNMDHQWISMDNAKRFSSDASLYTVLAVMPVCIPFWKINTVTC